jgi:DNA replication and repair protein RecF
LSYERGLRQRNKLLEAIRDQGAHRHQLLFWDQLLIKAGEYITKKREEYIDFVNNFQFASTNLQLDYKLIYDKSIISRMRLDQYSEEEVAAGVTLVGPHRDDIIFEIRNPKSEIRNSESFRNLSSFGSRGEQRLAVLWLKLAELQFIEKISFQKPVLLLDDVMSEFDHEHRRIIFEMISGVQTIITTTDMHFLPKNVIDSAEMIKLG